MANPANDVVAIELSETVKVIQLNSTSLNVYAWAVDSSGEAIGRVSAKVTGGDGSAHIVTLYTPREKGKHYISITPSEEKLARIGTVYVRVYCEERPEIAKTLTIYVVSDPSTFVIPDTVSVTGIQLSETSLIVPLGETRKLTATVTPSNATCKDVKWKAGDAYSMNIVTVDDNGNVYGWHLGTTTVTATSEDGGFPAKCTVTVVEGAPEKGGTSPVIQGVELSQSSLSIAKGQTAKIRVRVVTSDGSVDSAGVGRVIGNENYVTTSGSTKNGNVTEITLRGRSEGTTTITFYSLSSQSVTAILNVNVTESGDEGGGDGGGVTPDDNWNPEQTSDSTNVFRGISEDEEILDITSVGNTLIISTDKDMYYFLWKENDYHFLGNRIPIPAIHFRMGNLAADRQVPNVDLDSVDINSVEAGGLFKAGDEVPVFAHENIGDIRKYGSSSKKYVFDNDYEKGFWNDFLDLVWGTIDGQVKEQAMLGKAVFPMFVKYAVRLYDGTEYAQSIPILLGADIERFVDVKGVIQQRYSGSGDNEQNILTAAVALSAITESYSIVMNPSSRNIFDGWDDIVKSVDIFVSPQLMPLQRDAAKFDMELVRKDTMYGLDQSIFTIKDLVLDPYYMESNQEKLILYYQNTYLAKSFFIDEFRTLPVDYVLDIDTTSDYIMTQEALKETPWSMHHIVGGGLFTYNNRLLLTEAEQRLSHGYPFLHSVKWVDGAQVPNVRLVYHLRGENGENVVICRNENDLPQITPRTASVVNGSSAYIEAPYAWLSYPDSRCYQIDVYFLTSSSVTFSSYRTSTFDQADVAYVFLGFGNPVQATTVVRAVPGEENTVYAMPNSLVMSKANNPFVFPAQDTVTFTAGKILNIAVATKALSEGQFGQFPLYVFTDEGVFALSVKSDGSFASSHPVSRDILLNRNALVGIEQGVFFAASRGLLLLQGSQVTVVSSLMGGHPEPLANAKIAEPFMDGIQLDDPGRFVDFIKDCSIAYDYANYRIILFNRNESTQYVYKFDTQSWHRMNTGIGTFVRTLNSYPEAVVVMENKNKTQASFNLSVTSQTEGAQALPGFVYTRDIALDGADIYKTISRLKVRGRYRDGQVRWQLQGSNDGIDYQNLHSLRGPSWKWYRLVIVSRLDPNERISYVELDYEPRFTDKIR